MRAGELAVAPRVDDPRGFALENRSGRPLTASFRYDPEAHVQIVVIEEPGLASDRPGFVGEQPV